MSESVFRPAREILTLVRRILDNVGEQESFQRDPAARLNTTADDRCTNEQLLLDKANKVAFGGIEALFQKVSQAIRRRVTA